MFAPRTVTRSSAAARGRFAGWLLGWALLACSVSPARAQEQVLLLAPETPDPVLIELYHRLEAELRIHGFDTVTLVSAAPEDSASNMLGAQASARGAFAAIAVVLRNHAPALDVWLVDRARGRTNLHSLTASAGDETANLVAVRAVDLLRSSVAARARQVPDAVGASAQAGPSPAEAARSSSKPNAAQAGDPAAVSGRVESAASAPQRSATSRTPETDRERETERDDHAPGAGVPARPRRVPLLTFRAEVFGLWQGSRFGGALGPALSVSLSILDRLRIGAMAAGARGLDRVETPLGTASVQQEVFGLELELPVVSLGVLQLSAAGGAGVLLLQAEGHVVSPLVARAASQWTWTLSAGPRLDLVLSPTWALTAALRMRLLMPDLAVAVASESGRIARPSFDAALGLAFSP